MGVKGFAEGGIASIVTGCTTHPLDLIKVRMQLQGETPRLAPSSVHQLPTAAIASFAGTHAISIPALVLIPPSSVGSVSVGVRIVQQEGVAALFSGVSATVLRAALYSTTRMGLYDVMKQKRSDPSTGNLPLGRKIAGGIGSVVGNPADMAMVRMQADGRLPAAQRRNYNGVGDAIGRMCRDEGVTSLWRDSSLTASQLASYDQIKESILANGVM